VAHVNYYEHHLGDWAAATGHLTWDEDMAYTRLLRAYYHYERAIPDGQQYRLAKAATASQRKAVDQVLAEFFELREGHYHQKRADVEVARFQDKQRKAKASADIRWAHTERNANASPNAMRTHSEGNALQTPDTRHHRNTSLLTQAPAFPPKSRPDEPPQLTLVEPPPPPAEPYRVPDCPHLAVLALWAEVLPSMPQHLPTQWRGTRAGNLRARWRETGVEKGWVNEAEGLAYMRKLFCYVGQSRFLTGRVQARGDKAPFVVELAWLVSPQNWAKTIEGKYHTEAA
jgi:uncharacterized protein YdaU (DUF1376 family)